MWNLCKRGLKFFQKNLYRVPGNGKCTLLWQDKIMGQPSLDNVEDFKGVREWLKLHGYNMLAKISAWDEDGNW